jgi:ubiquinone/menaquinone biosynthesis C-methylase UbiE
MKLNLPERWFVNSPFRYGLQKLVMQWFKATMPLKPGSNILEIGCGRGAGAGMLLKSFKPNRLCLLDVDVDMIKKARRLLSTNGSNHLTFSVGNATHLPFEDAYFDAVFGFGFLHHVVNWREGMTEIARVLQPEGKYFIEEYYPSLYQNIITKRLLQHPEEDRFDSRQLRKAFEDTDLALVHTFELKRLGILGIGVKTEGKPFSCKDFPDSCRLPDE